jgi:signal transduction histidine kinase
MRATRIVQTSIVLLIVGFLALLFIVGMALWLGQRAQSYSDEALAARDARIAAVDLRYAIQTAESSQRGYLLGGNEIYLAPYTTAKTLAEQKLAEVQKMPSAMLQPAAQQRLAMIVAQKFREMDTIISLKHDRRDSEATDIFRTNRGKALMDEANVFLSAAIRAGDERLTQGVAEQNANAALLRLITLLAGIVIVVVVGTVAFILVRYTRDLAKARDEVTSLNAGLEERVALRTADLAQANAEIQRFAYIVTHDLRAPLVNIVGFTSEVERGIGSLQALIGRTAHDEGDPVVKQAMAVAKLDLPEAIGFIRSSTRKMDRLINSILKLAREGRRTLRPEHVDLAELIKASAAAVQHQVSAADGEIALDLSAPAMVTDRLSLEQIIGNLLDNAVKYRAKDRPLRIAVAARPARGGRVEIEVTDNGRGIADSDRERVFELFRRAGPNDQPGEGIGLALVRTLVRNLGGNVALTSMLGEGTTFRLSLPTRLQVPESAAA